MSVEKNYVRLDGNLGRDPEYAELESGVKYAKLSLATKKSFKKDSGDWETKTNWHTLVAFGDKAQRIKDKCVKGDRLIIEGSNQTSSWVGDDGVRRSRTDVNIKKWEKISSTTASKVQTPEEEDIDDLPF